MDYKRIMMVATCCGLLACGGAAGTEVGNVLNLDESTGKQFVGLYATLSMNFLPGWTYTSYDIGGESSDADAFVVTVANTRTVVHIRKGDAAHITVFEALLQPGQTLADYVHAIRPTETVEFNQMEDPEGVLYVASASQTEPGPHGGAVFDIYFSDNISGVIWLRAELVGQPGEQEALWNEFWSMVTETAVIAE